MTILNVMLGRGRGGLEQAVLDYAEGLALAGIETLSVLAPGAWIEAAFVAAGLPHEALANRGNWDWLAALRLRRLAKAHGAQAIICHGNRALVLALKALKGRMPVIAVAHNYSTRRFARADHCFAITPHLADHLRAERARTLSVIPNMVRLPPFLARPSFRTPPVIGAFGRLVHKKGFDILIDALAELALRGIAFHAVIGGAGPEEAALRRRVAAYELDRQVTFLGWIKDKEQFFEQLDLFVLPSRHEAFGIVLIEAMAHGVPVITSDVTGPISIVRPATDGVLIPAKNVKALADALAALLADEPRARQLGEAGRARVIQEFTVEAMARRLQNALAPYVVKP